MNFNEFKHELDNQLKILKPEFETIYPTDERHFFWLKKKGTIIGTEIFHYEVIAVDRIGNEVPEACGGSIDDYKINLEIHFEFGQKEDYVFCDKIKKLGTFLGRGISERYNQKKHNQVGIIFQSFNCNQKDLVKDFIAALEKMDKQVSRRLPKVFYKFGKMAKRIY